MPTPIYPFKGKRKTYENENELKNEIARISNTVATTEMLAFKVSSEIGYCKMTIQDRTASFDFNEYSYNKNPVVTFNF